MIATRWFDSMLDGLARWTDAPGGCLYFCSVAAFAMVSAMVF